MQYYGNMPTIISACILKIGSFSHSHKMVFSPFVVLIVSSLLIALSHHLLYLQNYGLKSGKLKQSHLVYNCSYGVLFTTQYQLVRSCQDDYHGLTALAHFVVRNWNQSSISYFNARTQELHGSIRCWESKLISYRGTSCTIS